MYSFWQTTGFQAEKQKKFIRNFPGYQMHFRCYKAVHICSACVKGSPLPWLMQCKNKEKDLIRSMVTGSVLLCPLSCNRMNKTDMYLCRRKLCLKRQGIFCRYRDVTGQCFSHTCKQDLCTWWKTRRWSMTAVCFTGNRCTLQKVSQQKNCWDFYGTDKSRKYRKIRSRQR